MTARRLFLVRPRGFCAGVHRAVDAVNTLIEKSDIPVHILHELVHNEFVIHSLKKRGVIFVQEPEEVPEGGLLVYSAHGVSLEMEERSMARHLQICDATCPLVKKIHTQLTHWVHDGVDVILIGHRGHAEIEGTLGRTDSHIALVSTLADIDALPSMGSRVACLTQTTLSPEDVAPLYIALKLRYPQLEGSGNICYATRSRQQAVHELPSACDTVIVVGSQKSSNTRRLYEAAAREVRHAMMIESAAEFQRSHLNRSTGIAVTSGASTPEILVAETIQKLKAWGWPEPELLGHAENMTFQQCDCSILKRITMP